MGRINVSTTPDAGEPAALAGWFHSAAATRYDEGKRWGGDNMLSLATGTTWDHETLWRTARGRWVVQFESQWVGRSGYARFVTDTEARDWLIRNEYSDEEVKAATGRDLEPERGPGQPQIGTAAKTWLPDADMAVIDEGIESGRWASRSAAIRELVAAGLDQE